VAPMTGRTVLITGGARGMGRVTAKALAAMGAEVIIADWEGEHGTRTCAEINLAGPGRASFIYCNLSSPPSVRALAQTVQERHGQLHVLINNAGITYPHRQVNEDGNEMHFATCHLGHFLLTHLLLEPLKAGAQAGRPSRILFISSEGHRACRGLDFDDLNNESLWKGRSVSHGAGFMAYSRAKLANILVVRELHQRLNGSGVTVNAISPGFFVNTGIHREMRGLFKWGALLVFGVGSLLGLSSAAKGARTHIWAASSPDAEGLSGKYLENCREKAPAPECDDVEARRRLWAISETLSGLQPLARSSP
jgi:retinol dehydrogenase 12